MKKILVLLFLLFLTGCANVHMNLAQEEPIKLQPRKQLSEMIPELDGPPITIAVYGFTDKTGQKKPSTNLALFSTAVTQCAEVFLIKALQDSKKWFKVVERVGLDNIINGTSTLNDLQVFSLILFQSFLVFLVPIDKFSLS